jgi:hypothetical protein
MMLRSEVFCGLAWSAPQISPDAEKGGTIHRSAAVRWNMCTKDYKSAATWDRTMDCRGKLVTNHQNCHILNLITISAPPIFLVEPTYILCIYIYLIICVRPYAYGGVRPCALTQLSAEKWPSKDIVECQKMTTFVFVSKMVPYFSHT